VVGRESEEMRPGTLFNGFAIDALDPVATGKRRGETKAG